MKNLLFALFGMIVLTSCEGDQGPIGPPGPQGPYIAGTVFEIADVDFTPANQYSFLGVFRDYIPADIEVYESDVVLVYLLERVVDGNDVWSLLPQTFYLAGGGTMQYNYNHTDVDFEIYLQGNVDLSLLDPSFTQNQVFRIAILPADFANSTTLDITDYNAVMSAIRVENPDFEIIQLEK